eukprot:GHVS01093819.1.p1 GENE.GHVS01093819.1~~GHVS01093819.1.p1  ORF type:complete len:125 (+),score=4.41 GHVS01093819.1:355-729(+)
MNGVLELCGLLSRGSEEPVASSGDLRAIQDSMKFLRLLGYLAKVSPEKEAYRNSRKSNATEIPIEQSTSVGDYGTVHPSISSILGEFWYRYSYLTINGITSLFSGPKVFFLRALPAVQQVVVVG